MKNFTMVAGTCLMLGIGAWLGVTIHGTTLPALLTAVAGAAAGFGMTGAAWQIVELRRLRAER
ncbi:MAG: hypothetical protein M3552_09310 [Planctomycetota bacterium]|nr:hypothetical protein [Planctomycetaceae bacterium]MDQ3330836.1 hypothetical protein [Planctomycetota bacterium]